MKLEFNRHQATLPITAFGFYKSWIYSKSKFNSYQKPVGNQASLLQEEYKKP